MVSGFIVASLDSDVTIRDLEINKPIARKRYAPRKQSLVHSKGSLKSSLRVCSQTFTFIALILAIVTSVVGGLFNLRLIDLCDFWHVAKRRSHQAIQRIYISVHQQKLEIKDFIKHLNT